MFTQCHPDSLSALPPARRRHAHPCSKVFPQLLPPAGTFFLQTGSYLPFKCKAAKEQLPGQASYQSTAPSALSLPQQHLLPFSVSIPLRNVLIFLLPCVSPISLAEHEFPWEQGLRRPVYPHWREQGLAEQGLSVHTGQTDEFNM